MGGLSGLGAFEILYPFLYLAPQPSHTTATYILSAREFSGVHLRVDSGSLQSDKVLYVAAS